MNPESVNGLNLFAYCNNNPIMNYDPTGYFSLTITGWKTTTKIVQDILNFDILNTNEDVVLQSNYFSFYKGSLVIRHSIPKTSSWGILKMIFLNRNETHPNSVKHEWGHNVQERILGTGAYLFRIGIPSIVGYFKTIHSKYYSQPWEYSADLIGGVTRTGYFYSLTQKDALWYLFTGITETQWLKCKKMFEIIKKSYRIYPSYQAWEVFE